MNVATDVKSAAPSRKERAKHLIEQAVEGVAALEEQVSELKANVHSLISELSRYQGIDLDEIEKFLKEPWLIQPKKKDEYWVFIPRWVGLSVGWLERTTPTYNVFTVNRYSAWFGEIPGELKDVLKIPDPFQAVVEDGRLRTSAIVAERFKDHLAEQAREGEWRITRGHEFDLIAQIIEAGALPFQPRPVDPTDLREVKFEGKLSKLRSHQEAGWQQFIARGAVGIYWPFGQGKTTFGLYAVARLKGPKLIVVPTVLLVQQWQQWLAETLTPGLRQDIEVVTYNAWERVKDKAYTLVVFDECHRLPADTFSRLSSLKTKYRMGLSASPHREDGREPYIIGLTGFPIGADWQDFIREGKIKPPHIEVRVVRNWTEKMRIAQEEAKDVSGRVIIFCDGINRGKQISSRLECPFVYGQTDNRLEVLKKAKVAVVSRVADEGLSLPDLRKVIEVDFHGSSRRQESQRVGRLLHAEKPGEHIVLMTQDEFSRFEGRFYSLEEKGFRIQVKTV